MYSMTGTIFFQMNPFKTTHAETTVQTPTHIKIEAA